MTVRSFSRASLTRIAALLLAAFVLAGPPALAGDDKKKETGTANPAVEFAVRGRVVTPEGEPVPALVMYFWLMNKGVAFAQVGFVDGKLTPMNPSAKSDDDGFFEISVSSQFVKEHRKQTRAYTLGRWRSENPDPVLKKDAPIGFSLDVLRKLNHTLDLGTIVLHHDGRLRLKEE